jgi:glycosyltransferase involved in cell wall biosynthesis
MKKAAVTFVVPGDNLSGGIRVTAVMGNHLFHRGHQVRIVYPRGRLFSLGKLARLTSDMKRCLRFLTGQHPTGWLHVFSGTIEQYGNLNELEFQEGEIVIAVGSLTLSEVHRLRKPHVIKVRYNHGFPFPMTEDFRAAMSLPMPTITVSNTLVPDLERLSDERVQAVVPNGIDTSEYYPLSGVKRDSIGTIFSSHPTKAPQVIVGLCNRVREVFPNVQIVVFGSERRPSGLGDCLYEQYPSIDRVREVYSRSLIWLLASNSEGFALPVLEAMACGAVVISTGTYGGLELIKDGINGMIVPKGDVDAFVQKIRVVLSDDKLREQLVQGGFDTVRKFTWAAAADRMEDFLQNVVQG